MKLSLHEVDKLKISDVGQLAQRRLARGLLLNIPEAIAILASQIIEFAREGDTVSTLMDKGRSLLGKRQVMAGVAEILDEVQVEATFPDGTKLVTLHNPICLLDGNLELALVGSFLPIPQLNSFVPDVEERGLVPGAYFFPITDKICINKGRSRISINVTNCADRPIQVGSHYHFIETNPMLKFDRIASYGRRLDIASGTAVRFEPGESRHISLVEIGGHRVITGGNGLATGPVNVDNATHIKQRIAKEGFLHEEEEEDSTVESERAGGSDSSIQIDQRQAKRQRQEVPPVYISREVYARMYGPTTGDIVRLADTELFIRVEGDFTVYGDECKFGGGKVLREGMGQATGVPTNSQLDTVITNALIIDYNGIYKADIGIKDGYISHIGKAGNPDVMQGVTHGMIVGVNTEVIAGEGMIVTAGGFDSHVHFICPDVCHEALSSGVTTMLGGGTGPAAGTCATTCTPHPNQMKMMMRATDTIPVNIGFTGKGNSSSPEGLVDIIAAGAVGLKLHEDWGTTPSAIHACLNVADEFDVQVTIHTDTLNESCCVEKCVSTFQNRTIHTYHTEGAGGGHAPDIITVCSLPNVLPSSTNPTRPLTVNTIDEHLDMLMVCHHLNKSIAEDVSFAESRIRSETIAAEDILHDMGAISMMSSDSQAMGRVGEVIMRTWQTADKMKRQRGQLPEDAEADAAAAVSELKCTTIPNIPNDIGASKPNMKSIMHPQRPSETIKTDNFRVKRYIAKYTINPAIAQGMSHVIGSIAVGKLADLVVWKPAFFGAKPEMVIKGGYIAWSQMGDANASIPTPQPVLMRPMFAAIGAAASSCSITFVSKLCIEKKSLDGLGLQKHIKCVENTRKITKKDMIHNDATPRIKVDPETFRVTADGIHLDCLPATTIPLGRRYFL